MQDAIICNIIQSLHKWLTHCMFSPVAAVRAVTYRLLVTLCFEKTTSGGVELGTPVDIAHVLKKLAFLVTFHH